MLFKQVLQALNYIHSLNIAHRDIKPENFLFETKEKDSALKIIDFGLSKIITNDKMGQAKSKDSSKKKKMEEQGRMNTVAGTPNYVSPEVLAGNYSLDCDMWSAGCLLYILLCGYPPFDGDDDYELSQNILKGRVEFDGEEWEEISKEAKNLINNLICKPEKRLTAGEALQHKWFKKTLGDVKQKIDLRGLNFQDAATHNQMKQVAMTAISV